MEKQFGSAEHAIIMLISKLYFSNSLIPGRLVTIASPHARPMQSFPYLAVKRKLEADQADRTQGPHRR